MALCFCIEVYKYLNLIEIDVHLWIEVDVQVDFGRRVRSGSLGIATGFDLCEENFDISVFLVSGVCVVIR